MRVHCADHNTIPAVAIPQQKKRSSAKTKNFLHRANKSQKKYLKVNQRGNKKNKLPQDS